MAAGPIIMFLSRICGVDDFSEFTNDTVKVLDLQERCVSYVVQIFFICDTNIDMASIGIKYQK